MPVPNPSIKVVIGGTIETTQDWSFGLWLGGFSSGAAPSPTDMKDLADDVSGLVSAWWTDASGIVTAATKIDYVRSYYYPSNAHLASVQAEHLYGSPLVGVGSGATMPAQLAVVHSLRTAVPGRRGRGRVYLPFNNASNLTGTSGQISSGITSALPPIFATMLEGINALGPYGPIAGVHCVVRSQAAGEMFNITSVIVDSKVDTQRRREDKIAVLSQGVAPVT